MTEVSFSLLSVYRRKIENKLFGVISLTPKTPRGKHALVSYVKHPFLISQAELDQVPHTNPFECLDVVQILLEAGYAVDVIDWTDRVFVPKKTYDLILDVHQNIERLKDVLPEKCVKIFYITGAHWKFQNAAEQKRLDELSHRTGKKLSTRRQLVPGNNIEYCDFALALGSDFAKDTYMYAGKPIEQIPLPSTFFFESPEHKNFEACRKHFVWIGGGGAVHKGLDVVLEAFRELPDYKLTVCGPVHAEKDFTDLYKKELFETPSIKAVGRIHVQSKEFKDILAESVALVYPSCSEGQSGAVITALQGGLIPLISYESGVDVQDFGIILKDHSPHFIREAVISLSQKPASELKQRAIKAWQYARTNHSREVFRATITKIFKEKNVI